MPFVEIYLEKVLLHFRKNSKETLIIYRASKPLIFNQGAITSFEGCCWETGDRTEISLRR